MSRGNHVTLTGHSLGGHLAAIGARMFPELFSGAVTFNAPGHGPDAGIADLLGVSLSTSGRKLTDEIFDSLLASSQMDRGDDSALAMDELSWRFQ